MRARINAFIVCIDKQSFFYQTVQPAKSSVRFDFHLFSLLQQLCAGELVAHHFKKCIPVGIGSMFDLCGRKKRQDMCGMTIERSYKLQHRMEIFSGDCHIPTGDNAVFDIIGGNLLVRGQQRAMELLISLSLASPERKNRSAKRALNSCFCSSVSRSV